MVAILFITVSTTVVTTHVHYLQSYLVKFLSHRIEQYACPGSSLWKLPVLHGQGTPVIIFMPDSALDLKKPDLYLKFQRAPLE